MHYPTRKTFRNNLKGLPRWAVPLVIVLLYGRLVFIALWEMLD